MNNSKKICTVDNNWKKANVKRYLVGKKVKYLLKKKEDILLLVN